MSDHDPNHLKSLNHTLDIIEALAAENSDVGVRELAEKVSLSKSAVHRILSNLVDRGYVQATDAGRYHLGIRLWEVGAGVVNRNGLSVVARSHMQDLGEKVDENVLLAIYDHGSVVYIDKVESDHDVQAYSPIGGRAPAHSVASGQALLAHQTDAELRRFLSEPLPRFTANTIVDAAALRSELDSVRQRGYAVNYGQRRIDVNGVAAPVRAPDDRITVALSVSGPAYRFGAQEIEKIVGHVLETAGSIGDRLRRGSTESNRP